MICLKKCLIINLWYSNNIGAALTAFALYRLLENNGYEPYLLTSPIKRHRGKYRDYPVYKFILEQGIRITDECITFKDFKQLNEIFDTFLLGSDQVLRLEWIPDEYYLNAIHCDKNMLVVAGSFGIDRINNSRSRIKGCGYYLSRFNGISLRETSGLKVYNEYFVNRNDLVRILDPVFLIDEKMYSDLIDYKQEPKQKFVFSYILDDTESLNTLRKRIAAENDITIIENTGELGVKDFLYYIKNSEMILTDSFHAMCFSLIFNKKFHCFYTERRGNARIESLIELLNLPKEIFHKKNDIRDVKWFSEYLNYTDINTRLMGEKEKGLDWIISSIDNPKEKNISAFLDGVLIFLIRYTNIVVGLWIRAKKFFCKIKI